MGEIIYRSIEKSDHQQLKEIINHSFRLHQYVDNEKVLDSVLEVYLRGCLLEHTYSCVAEKDGAVVGVIMGQAKKRLQFFQRLGQMVPLFFYMLQMRLRAARYRTDVADYVNMQNIYAQLLSGKQQRYDGILTLFGVREECRGLGVGKQLWHNLRDYLQQNGVSCIYLYTDSSCNYGFYDKQGFERTGERSMFIRGGNFGKMDVFLYEYTL